MLGERPSDGIDVPSWEAQHEETDRMTFITIGLDIAKSVFQVHVEDVEGHTVTQRRLRRSRVAAAFTRQPAQRGRHGGPWVGALLGRLLLALDHDVRLIQATYVKPFARRRRPVRRIRRCRPVSGGTFSDFGATPVVPRVGKTGRAG
jgi:hypothetical protein